MIDQARILIVDDEESIRRILADELSDAGYGVQTAASGEEALARIQTEPVDLVLLDLKMDGLGGLEVMARLAELPLPPSIVILTAHASFDSAVEALRLGGFDYLTKPCSNTDLLACVEKGLARRRQWVEQRHKLQLAQEFVGRFQTPPLPAEPPAPTPPRRRLERRGLALDSEQELATQNGQPLPLTLTEVRLLKCLMERAGQVTSYAILADAAYGSQGGPWQAEEARQMLRTHLWRLQHKLGQGPDGRPYVVNVRGRGYKFVDE